MLAQEPIWPKALMPAETDESLFALLDAARLPFLVETLGASDATLRCLFSGDVEAELADVAPWLVSLDPACRFTQNLATQSDAMYHLWDHSPGVLIRSNASFEQLWQWCRKLLWVRDKNGTKFFLRWWDPKCFDITMPILSKLDAQLRPRDFAVTIITPLAWTLEP